MKAQIKRIVFSNRIFLSLQILLMIADFICAFLSASGFAAIFAFINFVAYVVYNAVVQTITKIHLAKIYQHSKFPLRSYSRIFVTDIIFKRKQYKILKAKNDALAELILFCGSSFAIAVLNFTSVIVLLALLS